MRFRTAVVFAALCVAGPVLAQQDVSGAKDHPLISRYVGSYIIGFDSKNYDEFVLPLGPTDRSQRFVKSERLEGRLTRILYVAPAGRSSLEVYRNFESALTRGGFSTLYGCTNEGCDSSSNYAIFKNQIYRHTHRLKNRGDVSEFAFNQARDLRYLAAKLSHGQGTVYASLLVALNSYPHIGETFNHPVALLEVIETEKMDTGMVTVNAESLAKALAESGHVAVYGIQFDFGSDAIRPESEATLSEIARLLQVNAAIRLYVVGHTDNVGGYDSNMDLSRRRADSVVQHLVGRGVGADRLSPVGLGFLAPVASNQSEEGRAKNRRVELVLP